MKKYISALTLSVILSACATRHSPDELSLVKYEKLKIPSTLTLPVPNANSNPLGYRTAQDIVKSSIGLKSDKRYDVALLTTFKIKDSSNDIIKKIKAMGRDVTIVDTENEIKRIKYNTKNGLSVVYDFTPMRNLETERGRVNELFD